MCILLCTCTYKSIIKDTKMIKVTATKLRNNLFSYLDKASKRDKMTVKPQILVGMDELIQPLEDIWEDYV